MFGLGINRLGLAVRRIISALTQYAANGFEPELVLDFENDYYRVNGSDSTFDDAVTFSRTGNATMVDSDGLIKWAPHNALSDSRTDDATNGVRAWTIGSVTVSATGVSDPLGGNNAVTLASDSENLERRTGQFAIAPDGTSIVSEMWVRSSTLTSIGVWSGGSITNVAISSSWQLISAPGVADASGNTVSGIRIDAGSVDVFAPRVYRSDLGGMVDNPDANPLDPSYVPTTGSARYLARRGHHVYNGTSWVNEGLLIESEARTNVVEYSNDFTDNAWLKNFGGLGTAPVITANYATSPDGTQNATRLQANSGGVTSSDFSILQWNPSSSGKTGSIWVKSNTGVSQTVYFRYAGPGDTTSTAVVTNEWTRIDKANENTSTYFFSIGSRGTANGNAAIDILVYGAQAEDAPTPSSYIPTNGATATRANEVTEITSALPTSEAEGTFAVEGGITGTTNLPGTTYLSRIRFRGGVYLKANSDRIETRLAFSNPTAPPYGHFGSSNNPTVSDVSTAVRWTYDAGTLVSDSAFDGSAFGEQTQGGLTAIQTFASPARTFLGNDDAAQTNASVAIKKVTSWSNDIGTAGIEEASS